MVAQASIATSRIGRLLDIARDARRLRLPWISLGVVAVLLICAAFAPLLTPHDPIEVSILDSRMAPGVSLSHPLGTDVLGRDILARLMYGARTAIFISLVALSTGAVVGTVLGLVAGYRGGWLDILIMRSADAALGFPTVLVAMMVVTILGAGIENIILAVVLTVWARFARMIRGEVLHIKELDFVIFAKIAGLSSPMIILRHIFPNTINTLMVVTSLLVGQVILLEASLSFLGWGSPRVPRPGASWYQKGKTKSLMCGGCPSFRVWLSPLLY
jgi:peptide/nickel transport system permease protein